MAAPGFEYFTSADVGAPALSTAAGSMIAVLDWVLVTKGGWEKSFTDTNLAVYRSLTGNRFYYRLADTNAYYTALRGYRAMTGVSTGTSPFPPTATATWGIAKGANSQPTSNVRYWGVRTNRYMVIVVEHGQTATVSYDTRNVYVLGDFPSYAETDAFNAIITGSDYVNINSNPTFPGSFSPNSGLLGPTGSVAGTNSGISGTTTGTTGLSEIFPPFTAASAQTTATFVHSAGRLVFAPFSIANSVSPNSTPIMARGRIPNLHQVFGPIPPILTAPYPTYDTEVFTLNGRSFITLCNQVIVNDAYDAILLETTDTDGAL